MTTSLVRDWSIVDDDVYQENPHVHLSSLGSMLHSGLAQALPSPIFPAWPLGAYHPRSTVLRVRVSDIVNERRVSRVLLLSCLFEPFSWQSSCIKFILFAPWVYIHYLPFSMFSTLMFSSVSVNLNYFLHARLQ